MNRAGIEPFASPPIPPRPYVEGFPEIPMIKFEPVFVLELVKIFKILQGKNSQLHAELQSVSYRLAQKIRRLSGLDLPSFPWGNSVGSDVDFPSLKEA